MIKILNELIDKNLNFMCKSKSGEIKYNNFIDLKGRKLVQPMLISTRGKGQWLAGEMKDKGLIKAHGEVCIVSELGYDIFQKGGWLKHLESQKTLFQKQMELQAKEEAKEKLITDKLEIDYKLSKWQIKTFWWIFGFGLFGGIYGAIDLITTLSKPTDSQQEQITKEQMESELSKLRTLILDQKNPDSLNKPKPTKTP